MEINKFVSMVLDELEDLKSNKNKRKYAVQEIEFELGVVLNYEGGADIKASKKFMGISVSANIGGDVSRENLQKVKIKLKPSLKTIRSKELKSVPKVTSQ